MKTGFYRIGFILITLILLSGWSNYAIAQKYYIGGKGGLTSFKLSGSGKYGGINSKFGANAGFIFGKKIVTDFNIQFELLYSQKGMRQKFTEKVITSEQGTGGIPIISDTTTKFSNTLTLSYLELPILMKKSFSFKGGIIPYRRDIGIVDFDIFFGPYFGYLLSPSVSYSSLMSAVRTENDTVRSTASEVEQTSYHSFKMGQQMNILIDTTKVIGLSTAVAATYLNNTRKLSTKTLNCFDVGIIMGAGFSIELSSSTKLFIDGRYSMGLLSIDKTYFSNDDYTIKPGGDKDPIYGTVPVKVSVKHNKLDLKNTGLGFNIGFIKYID